MNKTNPAALEDDVEAYLEAGFHVDIIRDCKKVYEENDGDVVSPVHLRALKILCVFGHHHGIDCSWIEAAFAKELQGKYDTNLVNFYMGAFVEAMKKQGTSLNQTKKAINKWIGMSTRQVEICHALFVKNAKFSLGSPVVFVGDEAIIRMASAVINNINKPYPSGYNTAAFSKLQAAIKQLKCEDEKIPIACDFSKKMKTNI